MIGLQHIRHHGRFYSAAAAGLALWLAAWALHWPLPPLVGGDAFFLMYLALMVRFTLQTTPDGLRRHASVEDEGILLIILLALAAVVLSLAAIFAQLAREGRPDTLDLSLVIASVPLGWATLHTIVAFHYAHLFYATDGEDVGDVGGLDFPGTKEPGAWDFVYFSFVIGMTAQVSDVTVHAAGMRRLVLAHAIVSFFYNTVLLALAVNVAVELAR